MIYIYTKTPKSQEIAFARNVYFKQYSDVLLSLFLILLKTRGIVILTS